PADLAARHFARHQPQMPVASSQQLVGSAPAEVRWDPESERRLAGAYWRLSIIRPALQHPYGSKERRRRLEEAKARTHIRPDGQEVHVSVAQLYEWIKRYTNGGLEALADKPRSDHGSRSNPITRMWDPAARAAGLSDARQQEIAEAFTQHTRNLWASDVAGWRDCATLAASRLKELCQAAGWDGPELDDACCMDSPAGLRNRVEAERSYAMVAVAARDARKHYQENVPSIRRSREGLAPMDVVIGDATPMDVYVDREDGSRATVKAIGWLDLATNRLWLTLYHPPKGKDVTRLQVAASFASMAEAWGLPRSLYLDNGSEYDWSEMMGAFVMLSRLVGRMRVKLLSDAAPGERRGIDAVRQEIIRAMPYNSKAKPIEGIFSVVQGLFAMLPEWLGGDRMKKKSANLGQAPASYTGGAEQLCEDIQHALHYYHNKPQGGSLGGRSPIQSYQEAIDAGWKKVGCRQELLLLAFADEAPRRVNGGRIRWAVPGGETIWYYHDDLLPYSQQRLTVRVARHDPRFAFVFDEQRLVCVASPDRTYHFLDVEGAKESARRKAALRHWVSDRKGEVELLRMADELARHNRHLPDMPDAPEGMQVEVSGHLEQMREALETEVREGLEERARTQTPDQLSQWGVEGDSIEQRLARQWEEEEQPEESASGYRNTA
ncbi:MAG: helix-turn-helix domain-containing protein, partial [Flavobacteriales bacterium]